MNIADGKRLTTEGARKIKNTAVKAAEKAVSPSPSRWSTPAGTCWCSSAWTGQISHGALGHDQGRLRGFQ